MYYFLVHLDYSKMQMNTPELNGYNHHKKSNLNPPVQPFATYEVGIRKWMRYKLNASNLIHKNTHTIVQLFSIEPFRKNCMLIFLREGDLIAPLPLRYFHRKQPIDLSYSGSGRTITITWSNLFYLTRGLNLYIEIIRFPRGSKPDFQFLKEVSVWMNQP